MNLALTEGPQTITRRGDTGVVISAAKYAELTGRKPDFKDFLFRREIVRGARPDARSEPDAGRRAVKVLLDTCALAEMPLPEGDPLVKSAVREIPADDLYLSVLSVGEIAEGIALLAVGRKKKALSSWLVAIETQFGDRILEVDFETARIWGE